MRVPQCRSNSSRDCSRKIADRAAYDFHHVQFVVALPELSAQKNRPAGCGPV
jgi:hypothetical protein